MQKASEPQGASCPPPPPPAQLKINAATSSTRREKINIKEKACQVVVFTNTYKLQILLYLQIYTGYNKFCSNCRIWINLGTPFEFSLVQTKTLSITHSIISSLIHFWSHMKWWEDALWSFQRAEPFRGDLLRTKKSNICQPLQAGSHRLAKYRAGNLPVDSLWPWCSSVQPWAPPFLFCELCKMLVAQTTPFSDALKTRTILRTWRNTGKSCRSREGPFAGETEALLHMSRAFACGSTLA